MESWELEPQLRWQLYSDARGSWGHGLLLPSQYVGSSPVRSSAMACLHPFPGDRPASFQPRCALPRSLLPAALGEDVSSTAKGGGSHAGRGSSRGRDASLADVSCHKLKR